MPDDAPLALVERGGHGIRITAVNRRAAAEGVRIGQALTDARAGVPALLSRPAEPRRDRAALLRLARWCGRYGPSRNIDDEDGLWIDMTGVAHLYGGEEKLLQDLCARFARFGLTVRAGLADTLGGAHALARFAPSPALAPPGETEACLAPLPIAGLRLVPEAVLLLQCLGLKRIGQLYALPRAALNRRFRSLEAAEAVVTRLDQALGIRAEPARPLAEPPALYVQRAFADPLISAEGLEVQTERLAEELCAHLDARGLGVRRIRLSLYRADGTVAGVQAGLSFACREAGHLMALLREKLATLDAGFGVDAVALAAVQVDRRSAEQAALAVGVAHKAQTDPACLIDRLTNRLGAQRVTRIVARASHIPERAQTRIPALAGAQRTSQGASSPPDSRAARPPLLLACPEPIRVVAEVPQGPPVRFTWRRVERRVARAQGPERIAPEWWGEIGKQEKRCRTRDYYRLEDTQGAGYWVFRAGLYGDGEDPPSWFLHGLFA